MVRWDELTSLEVTVEMIVALVSSITQETSVPGFWCRWCCRAVRLAGPWGLHRSADAHGVSLVPGYLNGQTRQDST